MNEFEEKIKTFVEKEVEPRIPKGTARNVFRIAKESFLETYEEQTEKMVTESDLFQRLQSENETLRLKIRGLHDDRSNLSTWVERLKEDKDHYKALYEEAIKDAPKS